MVGRGPRACPAWGLNEMLGLGEMVEQMARIDLLVAPRIPIPNTNSPTLRRGERGRWAEWGTLCPPASVVYSSFFTLQNLLIIRGTICIQPNSSFKEKETVQEI